MAHINLLPWRKTALADQQRKYLRLLTLVALMTLVLTFMVYLYYSASIVGQKTKNQYLKSTISQLNLQVAKIRTLNEKKAVLHQHRNIIEQLQYRRNIATQVLREISKIIPPGVYLIQLEKQGSKVYLSGKSESTNHLATLFRAVELSDLFIGVTPESITAEDGEKKSLSRFKIKLTLKDAINLETKVVASLGVINARI